MSPYSRWSLFPQVNGRHARFSPGCPQKRALYAVCHGRLGAEYDRDRPGGNGGRGAMTRPNATGTISLLDLRPIMSKRMGTLATGGLGKPTDQGGWDMMGGAAGPLGRMVTAVRGPRRDLT